MDGLFIEVRPDAQSWLDKAEEDWLSANWLLEDGSPVTTPALFHLQQSVEKWLKAFLVNASVEFEKKHDLGYLLQLTEDQELKKYEELLDELTPFAVELRYPGDLPVFSREEAHRLLTRVGEFRNALLEKIHTPSKESWTPEPPPNND